LDDSASMDAARRICIELGEKFQIQDDFLDCFGVPEVIGKIGTDIEDNKCSWLIVQALLLGTKDQLKLIEDCYGKHDPASVEKIKSLYKTLGLEQVYEKQETESYDRVVKMMADNEEHIPPRIFHHILKKIHKREK